MSYWIRLSSKEAVNHGVPREIAENKNNYIYGTKGYISLPTPSFIDSHFTFLAFIEHPGRKHIIRFYAYTIDELWDFRNPLEEPGYGGVSLNPMNLPDTLRLFEEIFTKKSMTRRNRQCFVPLTVGDVAKEFHVREDPVPDNVTVSYYRYIIPPDLERQEILTLVEFSKEIMPNWPPERRWGLGVWVSQFTQAELKEPRFSPFSKGGKPYIDLDGDGLIDLATLIRAQLDFD